MKPVYQFFICIAIATSISMGSFVPKETDELKEFLTKMADARMMDTAESKVALDRATKQPILDYANLMIKDQDYLLNEIEKFAKQKEVELPNNISDNKAKALRKLQQKTGETFDHKFLNMICIDHKRDVKKFTQATKSQNHELAEFAKKHLPMIQSHLDGVEKLKGKLKESN